MIRIAIPMLTEERRKDLIKVVKRNGEESKVAIRNERREANERFKKMHKNVEITEDDLKSAEGDVQKMTDKYIKMIDEILLQKEKEIMEV
jgi:ribosome recycling factor